MALLGVPANTMMRAGSPWAVIRGEVAAANNDLLVVGAPMAERPGTLGGVVASLLNGRLPCPLLVVRSTRREGEAK
jgi:nucleotide-binding universal stress UspA family protein